MRRLILGLAAISACGAAAEIATAANLSLGVGDSAQTRTYGTISSNGSYTDSAGFTGSSSGNAGVSGGSLNGSAFDAFINGSVPTQTSFSDTTKSVGASAAVSGYLSNGTLHAAANGGVGDLGGAAQANGSMGDTVTFHNTGATALPVTISWSIDGSSSYINGSNWGLSANSSYQFLAAASVPATAAGNGTNYQYTRSYTGTSDSFSFTQNTGSGYTPMTLVSDPQGPNATASMILLIPVGNTPYNFSGSISLTASASAADFSNTSQLSITIPAGDGGLVTYTAPKLFQPVPEPALGLAATGAIGLLRRRRAG